MWPTAPLRLYIAVLVFYTLSAHSSEISANDDFFRDVLVYNPRGTVTTSSELPHEEPTVQEMLEVINGPYSRANSVEQLHRDTLDYKQLWQHLCHRFIDGLETQEASDLIYFQLADIVARMGQEDGLYVTSKELESTDVKELLAALMGIGDVINEYNSFVDLYNLFTPNFLPLRRIPKLLRTALIDLWMASRPLVALRLAFVMFLDFDDSRIDEQTRFLMSFIIHLVVIYREKVDRLSLEEPVDASKRYASLVMELGPFSRHVLNVFK